MHTQAAGKPSRRDDEQITADVSRSSRSGNDCAEQIRDQLPLGGSATSPAAREFAGRPGADRLCLVVSLLGILSLTDSLAGIACLLMGPFTCFITWGLAYYVLLIGLPIHILALLAAAGRPRFPSEGLLGGGFALAAGLLGTALSGGVLWIVHGLLGKP
jgi:hypothetical protein